MGNDGRVFDRRLAVIFVLGALWIFAIGAKLVRLQVKERDWLASKAEHQQEAPVNVVPPRGIIYDCKGAELALSVEAKSLYAYAPLIKNAGALASRLAPILNMDRNRVRERLAAATTRSLVIKRKLSDKEQAGVEALKSPGLKLVDEMKRVYVNGAVAPQVVGFVDIDEHGKAGLERSYETMLQGRGGHLEQEVDALNRPYDHTGDSDSPGVNLVLTLDEQIQKAAQKVLAEAVRANRAKGGAIVILDPSTGAIRAMANSPTFDPNDLADSRDPARHNWAIESSFEPGSIFKVVTYSAAVEKGLINPQSVINIGNGVIEVGNHLVHDENRGRLTAAQALARSSNVAAIMLGRQLGRKTMAEYAGLFGFGRRTGIELPSESRGELKPEIGWDDSTIGSIPMGYQVGVTALQAAAAYAVIANGGEWIKPYIVSEVRSPDGEVIERHQDERHRVIGPETAATLKQMLEGVVIHGTGKRAQIGGYTAAGKTGTAHKVDLATKRYSPTRYTSSFAGFAPADDPKLVCIVSIDEPRAAYYGADVAAPAFASVALDTLQILGIEPEGDPESRLIAADLKSYQISPDSGSIASPSGDGAGPDDRAATPPANAGHPAGKSDPPALVSSCVPATGTTRIVQPPASPLTQGPRSRGQASPRAGQPAGLPVQQAGDDVVVPNLIGKGIREAVQLCASGGLRIRANGEGLVTRQDPGAGTLVEPGTVCWVTLTSGESGSGAVAVTARLDH